MSRMETSPLPHKTPFSASSSVAPGLPTPDPTPMEDTPIEAQPPLSQETSQTSRPGSGHQRRISNGIRPSMKRGFSLNQVSSKSTGTSQSNGPPFLFGPASSQPSKPILETFTDSPPSERKLPSSNSTSDLIGPPLPKLVYPENGSPIGPVRRLSSARGPAPRVGFGRRTQSLQYGQPLRPARQEKRCCTEGSLQPSIDLHEARAPSLPHFRPDEEVDALPRISQETLLDVLNGEYNHQLQDVSVIDCRFEYEFEGGHIDGALNFNDKDMLADQLFDSANLPRAVPSTSSSDSSTSSPVPSSKALILHCEYSHHRAPLMARYIRQRDRIHNQNHYPHLTYPELYLLEGGYADFFRQHPHRCFPQAYVEMDSKDHEEACERGMAKVKRRAKLSRAQTYAFGQSNSSQLKPVSKPTDNAPMPMLEDSPLPRMPTAPFAKPSQAHSDADAMDLDEVMDEQAKRRSITFDSPCLAANRPVPSGACVPRWLSRNSSY